ncbi:MAG: hypothetical protein QM500_15775 [Methylococcales bacterium]
MRYSHGTLPNSRTKLDKIKEKEKKEGIHDLTEMDYVKYLRTVLWREIKEWILKRDNGKCVICGAEQSKFNVLEVHHRSYELIVLEGKNSEMLVSLCPRCHEYIEFYLDGSKRKCMSEKDEKYIQLKLLHKEIVNNGLPIEINSRSTRGGETIEIKYTGNKNHLLFYSIDSLIFRLVHDFYTKNRDKLKLPLPFGREKLYQKSGVRIIDRISSKEICNIKIIDCQAIIKTSKICEYSIMSHIYKYISELDYWYVIK